MVAIRCSICQIAPRGVTNNDILLIGYVEAAKSSTCRFAHLGGEAVAWRPNGVLSGLDTYSRPRSAFLLLGDGCDLTSRFGCVNLPFALVNVLTHFLLYIVILSLKMFIFKSI